MKIDNSVVHYFSIAKNKQHGFALIQGFGARAIPVEYGRMERKTPVRLHIVGGLQFGALPILREIRATRAHYLFVDRAYFAGGPKTNRLRVCHNRYQKNTIEDLAPREREHYLVRARALGIELEPWHKDRGEHVLLVPPSAEICALFGLGDWKARTLERLKRATDRPIDVSLKGDPRPLAERLERCHCVVTWSSNVAVEAIVAGVPAIVGPESAARPLAGKLEDLEAIIAAPPAPADELREAWVASLQRGQFELAEIANGTARRILLEGAAR